MAAALRIPVQGSDEVVVITPGELDASVLDVLRAECPPLGVWLDVAKALLAEGRTETYLSVLREATSDAAAKHLGEETCRFERIQGLCSLAAYHALQSAAERDRKAKSDNLARANELLFKATRLDLHEGLPHLALGQLALAQVRGRTLARLLAQAPLPLLPPLLLSLVTIAAGSP